MTKLCHNFTFGLQIDRDYKYNSLHGVYRSNSILLTIFLSQKNVTEEVV